MPPQDHLHSYRTYILHYRSKFFRPSVHKHRQEVLSVELSVLVEWLVPLVLLGQRQQSCPSLLYLLLYLQTQILTYRKKRSSQCLRAPYYYSDPSTDHHQFQLWNSWMTWMSRADPLNCHCRSDHLRCRQERQRQKDLTSQQVVLELCVA